MLKEPTSSGTKNIAVSTIKFSVGEWGVFAEKMGGGGGTPERRWWAMSQCSPHPFLIVEHKCHDALP